MFQPDIDTSENQKPQKVKLDEFLFQGFERTESVCLKQGPANDRKFENGGLCVKAIRYLFADSSPD